MKGNTIYSMFWGGVTRTARVRAHRLDLCFNDLGPDLDRPRKSKQPDCAHKTAAVSKRSSGLIPMRSAVYHRALPCASAGFQPGYIATPALFVPVASEAGGEEHKNANEESLLGAKGYLYLYFC